MPEEQKPGEQQPNPDPAKGQEGKKPDGAQAPTAEELAALRAENQRLQKENADLAGAKSQEEEERLRKQGEFEKLATKNAAERDAIALENKALKRRTAINAALYETEKLEFAPAAVLGVVELIENETEGKLDPKDVIKKAQEKLRSWNLASTTAAGGLGGGGTPPDRGGNGDPRIPRYIELAKQARTDRSKQADFVRLQAELERDKIPLPYVA